MEECNMLVFYGVLFIGLIAGIISILVMLAKADDIDEDLFTSSNDNNDFMTKL